MIVKRPNNSQLRSSKQLLRVVLIATVILVVSVLLYKHFGLDDDKSAARFKVTCNAEHLQKGKFLSDNTLFNNGKTRSDNYSYRGTYSSKVDSTNRYGFAYKIENAKPNTRYKVSVYRYIEEHGKFPIAINTSPNKSFSVMSAIPSSTDGKWEKLTIEVTTPDDGSVDELRIFPYQAGTKGIAYFDNLEIEVLTDQALENSDLEKLHIYLDAKALNKISTKRKAALKNGILMSADDDWVNAKLTSNGDERVKVKLRLKGDWTDHLRGDYWSYRIKMPSDKSWKRMQTFSIQDPKTRSYLDEWLYHKALEKEDIITPRYGFLHLSQNEKQPVLYAYEEHFDKQIAEYKSRREGVIVKFDEGQLWEDRNRNKDFSGSNYQNDIRENAEVLAFKQSKTLKSPKLREQYYRAQDLMTGFKNKTLAASEVFDMEIMGRYMALSEVLCAYHGLIWHNLRFYYNPITRKLEPIGFDGFTDQGKIKPYTNLFFGEYKSSSNTKGVDEYYRYIFRDEEFNKYYLPSLETYSSSAYVDKLLDSNAQELNELQHIIRQTTKPDYIFDINEIKERASKLGKNIQPYEEHSIRAYTVSSNQKTRYLEITNYHTLPLEIIGSGVTADIDSNVNSLATIINSNGKKSLPRYTELEIPIDDKYIYFRLPRSKRIFSSKIKTYSHPNGEVPVNYSSSGQLSIPLDAEKYEIVDSIITIFAGNHQMTKPIIIPQGFVLKFSPGCTIDMIDNSYILSYGSFFSEGNTDFPIFFTSSDNSSQGVSVLQADQISKLSYTSFTNLNTLEENEWQMTGAVTFYESDVDMYNVTISNNFCEDALNIVRSSFAIEKLNINNTFADGFDCDFCEGKLNDSYIFDTGNDGLDYSGCFIDLDNIRLENIGDKGISAGEEATITISNTSISNAQIGIASKDLSSVEVGNVALIDCVQGFAAYRKKPEFGGASIVISSFTENNVERLINKDDESKIRLPKS